MFVTHAVIAIIAGALGAESRQQARILLCIRTSRTLTSSTFCTDSAARLCLYVYARVVLLYIIAPSQETESKMIPPQPQAKELRLRALPPNVLLMLNASVSVELYGLYLYSAIHTVQHAMLILGLVLYCTGVARHCALLYTVQYPYRMLNKGQRAINHMTIYQV